MSLAPERTRRGLGLTIGDTYEGDPLGDVSPSDITIQATEIGQSLALNDIDDPENTRWMQSSTFEDLGEMR